jgi:hypothetical protein
VDCCEENGEAGKSFAAFSFRAFVPRFRPALPGFPAPPYGNQSEQPGEMDVVKCSL